ncbi:TetR/AcrR family transcriptional regulator [Planococcus chinensis]|uniref:TetR/AcrR family transcriptional regulator n=1 Tax=Planococcus chinensis TaxID=272917 RepID=A0ABW4QD44_9BACL
MATYPDKRVERSKAALKEAFLELLEQKSFPHITVSEIVGAANYNRGTFYAHFKTKEALLEEVIADTLEEMIRQIRHPYRVDTVVDLHNMKAEDISLFTYFIQQARLYKILLSPHVQADFRHRMASAIEELFITEYDYALPAESALEPKWLYVYRAHGIAGLIIRWIEEDFPQPPLHMAKQVVELMLVSTAVFKVKKRKL